MSKKRFELNSIHFKELTVNITDNLKNEERHLSIYQLIDLLNEVSQSTSKHEKEMYPLHEEGKSYVSYGW